MKTYDWYSFHFEDGFVVIARSMSKNEIKREEARHGKFAGKNYAGRW